MRHCMPLSSIGVTGYIFFCALRLRIAVSIFCQGSRARPEHPAKISHTAILNLQQPEILTNQLRTKADVLIRRKKTKAFTGQGIFKF